MIEIECLCLATWKTFIKEFDDFQRAKRFCLKCKYSKKIKVVGIYNVSSYEELQALEIM